LTETLRNSNLIKRFFSLVCASLLALSLAPPADAANGRITFIRDAEIETIIASYATPLFSAAGLPDPSAVRVYLIQDDSINAFVAGGMNLFIYTGLLTKAERPNQLIGVLAHETGHIAGGHLARLPEALRTATIEAIVACVLGLGGAAASGQPGLASICQLGSHIGTQSLLSFTRTQESAADQAGLSYLEATGQSARGTMEFLRLLSQQEALLSAQQDPYMRTHPLTRDRIDAVLGHIQRSRFSDAPDRPEYVAGFKRMQAKLRGYIEPLARVLQRYPESDQSLEARYARAIAYYRPGQLNLRKALDLVDGLIAEHPDDPYFQELKGEILLKGSGRARDALPYYEASVRGAPHSPLLRLQLAMGQIATEDPNLVKSAITELEGVVREEPRNREAWHQLSIAYGRDGQLPMAALALAEKAAATSGESARKQAKQQAQRAMQGLPEGSPAWLRAQDIYNQMDREQ
jgi:predicted Zn-dependent protease